VVVLVAAAVVALVLAGFIARNWPGRASSDSLPNRTVIVGGMGQWIESSSAAFATPVNQVKPPFDDAAAPDASDDEPAKYVVAASDSWSVMAQMATPTGPPVFVDSPLVPYRSFLSRRPTGFLDDWMVVLNPAPLAPLPSSRGRPDKVGEGVSSDT